VKKGLVAALFALLVALGAGCGILDSTEVATADVGDCINNDIASSSISEFDTVECTEPHTAELIYKFDLPDGDFPGQEAIGAAVEEECQGSAFEDYVGTPYAESEIFLFPVTPTEQTWDEADDREVLCFGGLQDGADLTESVQGSGR
jgi:hypothetical protein